MTLIFMLHKKRNINWKLIFWKKPSNFSEISDVKKKINFINFQKFVENVKNFETFGHKILGYWGTILKLFI